MYRMVEIVFMNIKVGSRIVILYIEYAMNMRITS